MGCRSNHVVGKLQQQALGEDALPMHQLRRLQSNQHLGINIGTVLTGIARSWPGGDYQCQSPA